MGHHRPGVAFIAALFAVVALATPSFRSPPVSAQTTQSQIMVSCYDTGNGESDCTITLQALLAQGGTITATLPSGATFVSCGAAPALGTCSTTSTTFTFKCNSSCPPGSQLTEIVQGSASTAETQTVTSTGLGATTGYSPYGTPYSPYGYSPYSTPYAYGSLGGCVVNLGFAPLYTCGNAYGSCLFTVAGVCTSSLNGYGYGYGPYSYPHSYSQYWYYPYTYPYAYAPYSYPYGIYPYGYGYMPYLWP
jgi:hypothetical protein